MSYLTNRYKQRNPATPQTQPLPGTVPNAAGGQSFAVDKWTRLDRFLLLGTEGGSYYVAQETLTDTNLDNIKACLVEDPERTIHRVVEISTAGRAPKNDPALLVLALAANHPTLLARSLVEYWLPQVARTFTHLSHFLTFWQGEQRKWNRGRRRMIEDWYNHLVINNLVNQAIKYPQRDGWAQSDVLRLVHPKTTDPTRNAVYNWIVNGWPDVGPIAHEDPILARIWAVETIKRLPDTQLGVMTLLNLIEEYRLPREAIPTEWLKKSSVWEALAHNMPINALIRNLGNLTNKGLLGPNADLTSSVCERLISPEAIIAGRVHPINILMAAGVYQSGAGTRGDLKWDPTDQILDALEEAFYLGFATVKPSGLRYYIGVDVSGSMSTSTLPGLPLMTARNIAGALALMWARTQPDCYVGCFTSSGPNQRSAVAMEPLRIRKNMSIANMVREMGALTWGNTDCAMPMRHALQEKIPADVFVVITDNETWAGPIHPVQALQQYREKMHIPARFAAVAMTATHYSVADPKDAGMLDVVGFDSQVPGLVEAFAGASQPAQEAREEE